MTIKELVETTGQKVIGGIALSVAADTAYDTAKLEEWLQVNIEALIVERERLARLDELKTLVHFMGHQSVSGGEIYDTKSRIAQLQQQEAKEHQ